MSINYASGLSDYTNKGVCGLPESVEEERVLSRKIEELYQLLLSSSYTVVHTGAGVSTAVGIPDFRGPNGVWTLEKLGKKPDQSVSFENAAPSIAHQALVEFERHNIIHYLITQNVDGLHLRSGFPRDRLSILHGDMFLEKCDKCNTLFVRSTPSSTMGLRSTNTVCTFQKQPSGRICRGKLSDTILDWESDLPVLDYNLAIEHSKRAELHICVGTSLQMQPAASLPLLSSRNRMAQVKRSLPECGNDLKVSAANKPKLVIINLQRTKLYKRAYLNIQAPVDFVFEALSKKFGLSLPPSLHSPNNSFAPLIVLRSSHSAPTAKVPWRVLPHPLDGDKVRIVLYRDELKTPYSSPVANVKVETKCVTPSETDDTPNQTSRHDSDTKAKRLKTECDLANGN